MKPTDTEGPTFGTPTPGVDYPLRPGSYALLVHHRTIGLVTGFGGLHLPGGGADPGETPLDALRREVREEVGYGLTSPMLVGVAREYYGTSNKYAFLKVCSYFTAEITERITSTFEHELQWVPIEQVEARVFSDAHQWAIRTFVG